MSRWEFATAGRVLFGRGVAAEVPDVVTGLGTRPLVVTGANPERAEWLVDGLAARGAVCTLIDVDGEPDVAFAHGGAEFARRKAIDVVVAIGGGSAIDAGKAIAALAANGGDPYDYLEVVGRGRPLTATPLPFVAIPTTAGTGSEVTRNAVLAVPDRRVKVSLRHPLMLPRVAVVDPELTYTLPPAVTAATGLDALTQLIEAFLSVKANPVTDALCREGIRRAARSIRSAVANGLDADAREDMAMASLFGGLALANAGLGAVHGLAGPVGGMFKAAHGSVCAALLPHVMAANLAAARARGPEHGVLDRMDEVGWMLTARAGAAAADALRWLTDVVADLHIPRLSAWAMSDADIPAVVDQASRSSSMKGNPVALTVEELTAVMTAAL